MIPDDSARTETTLGLSLFASIRGHRECPLLAESSRWAAKLVRGRY